ncbi:MAG: HlyD family efflux transporter periplasmic adaptor subunit [Syntrophomonadaceae bacterium]|nr:HlyD family efflux transporter periplasmic adaptor subunit [Syntrophomonadaceae bacterium]
MKKRLLIVLLLLVTCLAVYWALNQEWIELGGVVEAPVIAHYSETGGKLVKSPLNLGQMVEAGELIAVIDDTDLRYQREQLESALVKQQMALDDLLNEADAAAVRQAQNNIGIAEQGREDARLSLQRAQDNFDRVRYLYQSGAVSKDELDQAETALNKAQNAYTVALTQVDNARQQLSLITAGASTEKIASAQASVDQSASQLRQLEERLSKHTVTALAAGTVISKNYDVGDIVGVGYDLLDISAAAGKYITAWLPVKHLYAVEYGQEATLKRNNDEVYTGAITWMDVSSEYTPKDRQTAANQNKTSVEIRISLDESCPLKPGEEVKVLIPR